jgi:hypothetical protein
MLVKRTALGFGLATVALLDLVLTLGNGRGPVWLFEPVTDVLAVCLLTSSALLGYALTVNRRRTMGALFVLNVAASLVGATMSLSGVRLNQVVLYVADVVWLTLYLVALTKYWSLLVD